jgi:hypothetical protein
MKQKIDCGTEGDEWVPQQRLKGPHRVRLLFTLEVDQCIHE